MLLSKQILISKGGGGEQNDNDQGSTGDQLKSQPNWPSKLKNWYGVGKGKPAVKSVKTKTKAKAVTKKAPAKGGKETDTDKVLEIINRSKKGVDTATLMKKTGFNQKKVRNMLNRTYKQGENHEGGKRDLCWCEVRLVQGNNDLNCSKNRSIIYDPHQSPYC